VEFECGPDESDLSGSSEYQEKVNAAFKKLEPIFPQLSIIFEGPIKLSIQNACRRPSLK
jgi:hypothetical protein